MRRHAFVLAAAVPFLTGIATTSLETPHANALATRARFTCYHAQFNHFQPKTVKRMDRFGAHLTLALLFPESVCAPAPGGAASYLTCYKTTIRATTVRSKSIRGFDEFGNVGGDVTSKGLTLCMPSARIEKQPDLRAKRLDAFTCYPFRPLTPVKLNRTGITVSDAFGTHDDTIKSRTTVCAPSAAEGGRFFDSKHFLSCYAVDSNVLGRTVLVRDDFGSLTASLGLRSQLCTAVT